MADPIEAVRILLQTIRTTLSRRTAVRRGPPHTPGTAQRKRRRDLRRGGR